MRITKFFFILLAIFSSLKCLSQRGIDGAKTISAANTIVNEYTNLTADAIAGDSVLIVAASGLNSNNRFGPTSATNSLQPGDLLMIIQMQGATINGTLSGGSPATFGLPNDNTWGGVTSINNTGNFEFVQVQTVLSNTSIKINCSLSKSYTAAGKVQVIRVPRYSTLLIQAPGVLTCQSWNGSTGGVLAVEVYGNTTILAGGKINVTGKGFRGGALFTPSGSRTTTNLIACVSLNVGTNKGEGVAGYSSDYNVFGGQYCRGAAANAGGGGNVWNCGGGGGANAGLIASWTGQGNPNNSVATWALAWEKEFVGFSSSTSSGGGKGGYSFSDTDKDATLLGPGTLGVTNLWGGSYRYNLGGLGGRPLDYSTGKIFLGGGGGAGEQDDNQGGAGGAGGGIVYLTSYGAITGSGNDSIISNGNNGGNTLNSGFNPGKDAAGGAGAGGAIVINSVGLVSGVFIKANGGKGGDQLKNAILSLSQAEGPGGGGGGGYIGVSNGPAAANQQSLGGTNGISQSPHVSEFLPNGATMGGAGLTNQPILSDDTISVANATICSGNTATLIANVYGSQSATISWYSSQFGGAQLGTGTSFTTPVLNANTTYYVGLCPGTYRIPVNVTMQFTSSPVTGFSYNSPICANGVNPIPTTVPGFTTGGQFSSSAGLTIDQNTGIIDLTTSTPGTYLVTYNVASVACVSSGSSTFSITINPINTPVTGFTYTSPICANAANPLPTAGAGFTTGGAYSYGSIGPVTGLSINSVTGLIDLALSSPGTYTIDYSVPATTCGPAGSSSFSITINPLTNPVTSFSYVSPVCSNGTNPTPVTVSNFTPNGVFSSTANLVINSSTGIIDLALSAPGSYNVSYSVASSGCMIAGFSISNITINPVTTPNTGFSYPLPLCANGKVEPVLVSGFALGGVFSSTNGLIINSDSGIVDLSASIPGTYDVNYSIASTVCGPAGSSSFTLKIDSLQIPVTAFTYNMPICISGSNPFPNQNLGFETGGLYTSSSNLLVVDSITGEINLSVSSPGSYVVSYNKLASGCKSAASSSFQVTISSSASPITGFSYISPVCLDAVNPAPIGVTSFTLGGNYAATSAGVSVDSLTGVINLTKSTPGMYTILYGIQATGCSSAGFSTAVIKINALPIPSITSDVSSGCAPLCVNFSELNGVSYNSVAYTFGDGGSATTASPQHCYTVVGNYSVTITCTDLNLCTGSTTINNMISVTSNSVANFTISPSDVVAPNTTVYFTDASSNADNQFWNFGNPSSILGNTSTGSIASHIYNSEGNYCVTLVASKIGGCADTIIKCIDVIGESTIQIPTVFTPNGDGVNDLFTIKTIAIKELVCTIYDRWGREITEWTTLNGVWDGRRDNSKMSSDGVYYYLIKATPFKGDVINKQGFFQLIL